MKMTKNKKSVEELRNEWLTRSVKAIKGVSENDSIIIKVSISSLLSNHAYCLTLQKAGFDTNEAFCKIQNSMENFFANLDCCESNFSKFEVFSLLLKSFTRLENDLKKEEKERFDAKAEYERKRHLIELPPREEKRGI